MTEQGGRALTAECLRWDIESEYPFGMRTLAAVRVLIRI